MTTHEKVIIAGAVWVLIAIAVAIAAVVYSVAGGCPPPCDTCPDYWQQQPCTP